MRWFNIFTDSMDMNLCKLQETVVDLIFLGSKITADGDCSHEIKRCLHLARKVETNLDSILKSRDITLPTKICLVKAIRTCKPLDQRLLAA